jgi:putative peptide zinc metalloprotease protein
MPLIKVGKFFWIPGRIYQVKRWRFYLSLSSVIALLAFLLFCPLPYWVMAPMVMELRASHSQQVYVPDIKGGCRLKVIDVAPGQFVHKGDRLGLLENQQLLLEQTDARGKVQGLEKQLASLEKMRKYRADAALRIGPVEQSLAAARELLVNKEQDYSNLTLVASMDGTVVSPPWKPYQAPPDDQLPSWWGSPLEPYNLEATFEPGTQFCSIGDPKYLEAVLLVNQSKTGFLETGQIVELKLQEYPGKTFYGEVGEIEKQAVKSLDVQLSTRAGGEVPTTTQRDGTEQPNSASYRVRVLLDNPDLSIRVGMTGIAKVHVRPKTLAMRAWLIFNETFNFKL